MPAEPDAFTGPARRQPDNYRPWTRRQVRTADSWHDRRDQPVSVALSPVGDRLALSVGQRLSVLDITEELPREPQHPGGLCAGTRPHLVAGRRQAGVPGRRRSRTGGGPVGTSHRPETEPRMSALGPASAMAFLPDGDRLAVLAPTLPGRMTLMVIGPNREVIWERGADQGAECPVTTRRGSTWPVAQRASARLHHGDVDGLGVRYRHRAAGAAIRRSCADRHGCQLDRRRMGPVGLHGRDAAGMAPGRRDALHRRGDHRGGGDGLRARAADRADLVGAG